MMTSLARTTTPPRSRVTPGEGAVWPAMVIRGSTISRLSPWRSMAPATSKTTILGPLRATAWRRDPGPRDLRLVTCTMSPPRPPDVMRSAWGGPHNPRSHSAVHSEHFP